MLKGENDCKLKERPDLCLLRDLGTRTRPWESDGFHIEIEIKDESCDNI